jgi:hypothetical protein
MEETMTPAEKKVIECACEYMSGSNYRGSYISYAALSESVTRLEEERGSGPENYPIGTIFTFVSVSDEIKLPKDDRFMIVGSSTCSMRFVKIAGSSKFSLIGQLYPFERGDRIRPVCD